MFGLEFLLALLPNALGAGASALGSAATAAGATGVGGMLGSAGTGLTGVGSALTGGGLLGAASPLAAAESAALAGGVPLELGATGLGSLSNAAPGLMETLGGASKLSGTGGMLGGMNPKMLQGMQLAGTYLQGQEREPLRGSAPNLSVSQWQPLQPKSNIAEMRRKRLEEFLKAGGRL